MIRTTKLFLGAILAVGTGVTGLAQDQNQAQQGPQGQVQQGQSSSLDQASPGWRRFGDQGQANQNSGNLNQGSDNQQTAAPRQQPQYQLPAPTGQTPSSITVPAGTWITVRMNQLLSTERNQPGDAFTASLAEPVISQGLVVARRGQTVGGRVTDSLKAGRVKGTSQLGVELTELSLVDGQQLPLKTQFVERKGDTSVGRDAGAIGVTTGLGAAIGAAAGGGLGAGIGAAAGAVVSTAGVLVTRGRPTLIYPETVMTFRLEQPLTITSNSMQAFRPPSQQEYNARPMVRSNPAPGGAGPYGGGAPYQQAYPGYAPYAPYPAPAYYGYGYGYPYAYGPSLYFGRGFYYGYRGRRW